MGDLRHYIDNKSQRHLYDNLIKLEWSIELFEGLSCMHSQNIVHLDINPK
jgi:serine/threonine protein kinase